MHIAKVTNYPGNLAVEVHYNITSRCYVVIESEFRLLVFVARDRVVVWYNFSGPAYLTFDHSHMNNCLFQRRLCHVVGSS